MTLINRMAGLLLRGNISNKATSTVVSRNTAVPVTNHGKAATSSMIIRNVCTNQPHDSLTAWRPAHDTYHSPFSSSHCNAIRNFNLKEVPSHSFTTASVPLARGVSSATMDRLLHSHCLQTRCQSTTAMAASATATATDMKEISSNSFLQNDNYDDDGTVIATGPDGTQYSIPLKPLGNYNQRRHAPKIPPHIVQSRISKLRSISGSSKNIRHSPWRLNLICQFVQGQTVQDALIQLKFVQKVKAPLIYSLVQGTMNSAKTKYGLLPSQLEIVECFATQGSHLKRLKMMGRGRAGKMLRKFSHARIVLREIDFPLKIMQCTSVNERKKWVMRMEMALKDQAEYRKEKEEIEALEREAAEVRKKKEQEGAGGKST